MEVIDPRHPLFGRRFPLLSWSASPLGSGQVFVAYRQEMVLRLPFDATTLGAARSHGSTKLTLEAIEELITVAEDCEALCPLLPRPSGPTCPQPSASRSLKTSRPSSRR